MSDGRFEHELRRDAVRHWIWYLAIAAGWFTTGFIVGHWWLP